MTKAVSLFFVATLSLSAAAPTPMPNNEAKELAGLWRAKLRYGPDISFERVPALADLTGGDARRSSSGRRCAISSRRSARGVHRVT